MASEIRVNSLSSRTGLSTVTFTDTGPIFSGITTFQDNAGFNVGTGGSIFSPASNTLALGTNSAERLRITSDGNIGINVTPTNYSNYVTLALNDTTGSTIEGRVGGTLTGSFSVDSLVTINAVTSIPIVFKTNNTERVRITSAGLVGIGTDNPGSNKLQVQGSSAFYGNGGASATWGDTSYLGALSFDGSAQPVIRAASSKALIFQVNQSTEALRITSAGNIGVGVANPSQKFMVKGIIASEATNSTNNWMAYTYTDNTFRLNYNGAGDDEVIVTSGGNISVGGASGRDFSLLDGAVINTANGSAGLLINSSSSSHNAYLGFSYGSGSSTSHADQFSAYIGRVGDNTLILGTDNNIRARVTSGGDVLIGGQSAYTYDDTGSTNTILDITNSNNNKRGILSLSGNCNANGPSIGTIWFNNDQNSGTGPGATMKLAAAIQAKAVTSDGNAGDDSGAYLQFLTKPESAALAEAMVIHSDGYVTKTKHPSFRVGRHTNYNHTGGQPVQFNTTTGTAHLNQGNHYNTSNHRFVAPVAGVYQFSACIIVNGIANNTDLTDLFYLYKNGTNMAYSMRRARYVANYTGTSGYYVDFMSNVNVLMAANDYCDIICRLSLSIHGNSAYTWFSGTLVG